MVEELPRCKSFGSLYPEVRRVLSAEYLYACCCKSLTHYACVLHIIIYGFAHLLFTLLTIYSLGSTLGNVACAVELSTLAAVPQSVQGYPFSVSGSSCNFLRYYCISAAHSGKSRCLRETAEFYGASFCSFYLEDRVGDIILADISFVGSVEENQCVVA